LNSRSTEESIWLALFLILLLVEAGRGRVITYGAVIERPACARAVATIKERK
jgi:hypothetical protein